ncbi:MAG: hypothetical protein H6925_03100 [Holosporaceae bacterium]|nr:MAG: hypothetical protein H6925_03100 [Holosporaceae bacterium]
MPLHFYRQGYLDKAIDLLNKVKADYPEPAYIDELMGQIYYENGKIDLSIQNYKRAISKMPPLIFVSFWSCTVSRCKKTHLIP